MEKRMSYKSEKEQNFTCSILRNLQKSKQDHFL